jgi:pimeloyl-ACP methyl ester carboxylesterase
VIRLIFALGGVLVAFLVPLIAGADPQRPPDGTYHYELRVGGAVAGTSTVVVRGGSDAFSVDDDSRFAALGVNAHAVARYANASIVLLGYAADAVLPSGSQHTDVTVTPGHMTVAAGTQRVDISADASAPLEILSDNFTGTTIMVPAIVRAAGAKRFTYAATSGGIAVVATVAEGTVTTPPGGIPSHDAVLVVQTSNLREDFWYDPATLVVDAIEVPSQSAEFRRIDTSAATGSSAPNATPAPLPTALPTAAPHFRSIDVTFSSADGTRLAGTLAIPNGRGPFPALVFVHGSGGQDRDERIGPNPIFLQLSNTLSNAGYAVLRYDKRGVGASGHGPGPVTRPVLLDDVRAALAYARNRPQLDPKRVFLLGHSEGAELAPTVAATDRRVAGLVLMAPPALPLWQVSLRQVIAMAAPADRMAAERNELAALAKIRSGSAANDAWFRSSMDVDPAVDIARDHCPVLILQGESDAQVLPADLPRLVGAARAAHVDVTVRMFSGDSHLFEPIPADRAASLQASVNWYLTVPERIDPRVTGALLHWLQAQRKTISSVTSTVLPMVGSSRVIAMPKA